MPPAAVVDFTTWLGPRRDNVVWVEASQGSDYTQRLPVKVAPLPALQRTAGPSRAHRESLNFLKGVVHHPSQFFTEEESDAATSRPASSSSQAGKLASSRVVFMMDLDDDVVVCQMESVPAEIMQEGAASDDTQRTESEA
ncbi:hypothetical protein AAVH_13162 [Aphelenchoides avenae]|nr:hypothetical protein AAVH_13162 [Aphelenchus avenae]